VRWNGQRHRYKYYRSSPNRSSFFQNNNVLVSLTSYARRHFPSTSASSSRERPTSWTLTVVQARLRSPSPHTLDKLPGSGSSWTQSTSRHTTQLNGLALSLIPCWRRGADLQCHWRISSLTFLLRVCAWLLLSIRRTRGAMGVWQLLAFPAQTMVYVSCNVHIQTRDVEQIVLVC
jgi:hypothetical protein